MRKGAFVLALLFGFAALSFGQVCDDGTMHGSPDVAQVAQPGGNEAQGTLTTLFASNNGFRGNMFDIEPLLSDLFIDAIDVNVDPAGLTTEVDVWYIPGTCVGNDQSSAGWTLLGHGTGTSAGVDLPTFIDLAGNGVQFEVGEKYGMYVDITNYPSPGINYTNGQYVFFNDDLWLETWYGKGDPAFTGSTFFPRAWNGTIYYNTSGAAYPKIDIKCNGEDAGVEIFEGANATLTIDVQAKDFAGAPCDIWVLLQDLGQGDLYSYGYYGNAIWMPGVCNVYFSGGLMDIMDTVLDMAVPVGDYVAYLGLDTLQNGNLNIDRLYKYDMVDFSVVVPPTTYEWDDGSTENLLCWVSGGDIVGFHRFDVIPGGENIVNVGSIFGSAMYPGYAPGPGTDVEMFIWDDPTPDMQMLNDCVLLHQEIVQVMTVDADTHDWYTATGGPIAIGTDDFWLGFRLPHAPYQYCLAIDGSSTYVSGSAFYGGCIGTQWGFDPVTLDNPVNYYPPLESGYGFWTVRGEY